MCQLGEVVAEKVNVALGCINRCMAAKYKDFAALPVSAPRSEHTGIVYSGQSDTFFIGL